ncbi:MAG: hypothetical protein M1828_000683 [Chrysothrix sp. TS-e1954]|nr:MAG: hypothetical protein M1828_000683 [Chrysothrix sp. TS-e1954]
MPPADSGSESSPGEDIPFRAKTANMKPKNEDPEEEDEDGEDEYVVEKIVDHKVDKKGNIKLQVKWEGWPDSDNTWEPEDDFADLEETKRYYRQIGGRPSKDSKTPKTSAGAKRKSIDASSKTSTPTNSQSKKLKKNGDNIIIDEDGKEPFVAPSGLWEDHIIAIDTIEAASGTPPMKHAYVIWKNNRKSKHRLPVLNQKCPQVMLRFYESHLHFSSRPRDMMGEDSEPEAETKPAPVPAARGKSADKNGHDEDDDAEFGQIKGVASAA